MATTAVLFPGQGSLTPDAAATASTHLPELVQQAEALLGTNPFERAGESTRYAQPAVFLASLAGWRALEGLEAALFAGHSLGELTALTAAGAFTPAEGLALAVRRGALMDDAARAAGPGAMAALLGTSPEQAEAMASRHGVAVANDNAPGQIVLSGPAAGIDAAIGAARDGGLRAMRLDVAAAFHSFAMHDAVEPFRAAVAAAAPRAPRAPVISGVTAQPFADVAQELARALVAPVRWREVMRELVDRGAERFVDTGPGRVLARLAERNAGEVAGARG